MSNVIKLPKATRSTRPEKIFMLDQVVQGYGILQAAITGELYFWIAKNNKPWRVMSDYAQWFGVSEKTIRRNVDNLVAEKFFRKSRTRLGQGQFGANQFTKLSSNNSETLVAYYQSLIANTFDSNDFGDYDHDGSEYRDIPEFQMLFIDTIHEVGDIKAAYLLDRICWGGNANAGAMAFRSDPHFARWANMDRKTAERKLKQLQRQNLVMTATKSNHLFVQANQSSRAFERHQDFMTNKEELRSAGILDYF